MVLKWRRILSFLLMILFLLSILLSINIKSFTSTPKNYSYDKVLSKNTESKDNINFEQREVFYDLSFQMQNDNAIFNLNFSNNYLDLYNFSVELYDSNSNKLDDRKTFSDFIVKKSNNHYEWKFNINDLSHIYYLIFSFDYFNESNQMEKFNYTYKINLTDEVNVENFEANQITLNSVEFSWTFTGNINSIIDSQTYILINSQKYNIDLESESFEVSGLDSDSKFKSELHYSWIKGGEVQTKILTNTFTTNWTIDSIPFNFYFYKNSFASWYVQISALTNEYISSIDIYYQDSQIYNKHLEPWGFKTLSFNFKLKPYHIFNNIYIEIETTNTTNKNYYEYHLNNINTFNYAIPNSMIDFNENYVNFKIIDNRNLLKEVYVLDQDNNLIYNSSLLEGDFFVPSNCNTLKFVLVWEDMLNNNQYSYYEYNYNSHLYHQSNYLAPKDDLQIIDSTFQTVSLSYSIPERVGSKIVQISFVNAYNSKQIYGTTNPNNLIGTKTIYGLKDETNYFIKMQVVWLDSSNNYFITYSNIVNFLTPTSPYNEYVQIRNTSLSYNENQVSLSWNIVDNSNYVQDVMIFDGYGNKIYDAEKQLIGNYAYSDLKQDVYAFNLIVEIAITKDDNPLVISSSFGSIRVSKQTPVISQFEVQIVKDKYNVVNVTWIIIDKDFLVTQILLIDEFNKQKFYTGTDLEHEMTIDNLEYRKYTFNLQLKWSDEYGEVQEPINAYYNFETFPYKIPSWVPWIILISILVLTIIISFLSFILWKFFKYRFSKNLDL